MFRLISSKTQKSRMAFIDMEDRRSDAERFQCPDSAYPQQYFLLYPRIMVPAVQPRSYMPVLLHIRRHVRVKQVEVHGSDLYLPYRSINRPSGQFNADQHGFTFFIGHLSDREFVYVEDAEAGLLYALVIYLLVEIALPVEQADRRERDPQVAGRFTMVGGQNAKSLNMAASRSDRILRRSKPPCVRQVGICPAEPGVGAVHICIELPHRHIYSENPHRLTTAPAFCCLSLL